MDKRHNLLKSAPVAVGTLVVLLLVFAMIWVIRDLMAGKVQKPERMIQNITVIRPPPPPPEETPPPPPPEKVEQQVQQQSEPEPTPDNAPEQQPQLGLDADASAGDDGFGLAARKGGADLVGTNGAAFAWYTGKVKDELVDLLSSDPRLRGKKYVVILRVWIQSDGRVKESAMTTGSGSRDLDSAIAADLSSGRFAEGPPLEMPQPITLKVVSRS